MKSIISTILSLWLLVGGVNAQYCGDSGPTICTPTNLIQSGFSPVCDSFSPIINNHPIYAFLEFKIFDSVFLNGHKVKLHSLKFDSIKNLPSGLCWRTNDTTNIFLALQSGCINIVGTSSDNCGQYKLHIVVDVDTGAIATLNADSIALVYYLRMINCPGDTSGLPMDTTQTDANPFILNQHCDYSCLGGINEVQNELCHLSIAPNPVNMESVISFTSDIVRAIAITVNNCYGSMVYRKGIDVRAGQNSFLLDRSNLAAGVYFCTISYGGVRATIRFVVMD